MVVCVLVANSKLISQQDLHLERPGSEMVRDHDLQVHGILHRRKVCATDSGIQECQANEG